MLPTDAQERKNLPITTGVLDYFPRALAEVARVSKAGNDQHNGVGTPLKWDKTKSSDHADALVRHLLERGKTDVDGMRHSAKLAWRALALLQEEIEQELSCTGQEQAQQQYSTVTIGQYTPTPPVRSTRDRDYNHDTFKTGGRI